jgi:GcrA cell cycle regulator
MINSERQPTLPDGDDLVIPPKERRSLGALKRNECRWPYGDPRLKDFYFCGKQKSAGHPYCGFHMRRAFRPSHPREYRPHQPRVAA